METRANSGGDPLAVDGTTEHFLFPAGFGSAAVEFLKGPFSESSSHHCATFPQKAKGKPAEAVIPALWKLKWSRAGTQ